MHAKYRLGQLCRQSSYANLAFSSHTSANRSLILPIAQTQLKKKEDEVAHVAPYSKSYNRTMISTIVNSESGGTSMLDTPLRIGGWVKTGRVAGAGAFAFLEVNDGSCFTNLQVMVDKDVAEEVGGLKDLVPTSTCVLIEGHLAETPPGTKQKVRRKKKILL